MLLEEFVRPPGIKQTELAEWMDVSDPRLNELIHGKRSLTPDTALRLEHVFGVAAPFWLNLQFAWDRYDARRSPAAHEIRKIRRYPGIRAQV
jgi:addiction module HigA family antidote